jgi:hypothetical protein
MSLRHVPPAIAVVYLAAHLPFLAPSLEDIDSINFALGLHDFDPARHQPHPPGYPVYMLLGRAVLALVSLVWPTLDRVAVDAVALALCSALAGLVAIVAAASLFRGLERESDRETGTALWATTILAVSPIMWLSGLRPMSDLPGLAAGLVSQALLIWGMRDARSLVLGAIAAGVSAGIRVQTVWLTLPLLLVALVSQRRLGMWWLLSRPAAGVLLGTLSWGIPLLVASGGVGGYLRALGTQAGEDFAWVDMLWSNPTPRRLAFNLYESLVLPWGSVPLGVVVTVAAVIGTIVALTRLRQAFLLLVVAFAPYAAFHIIFQETATVRYALPITPAIAWLTAYGFSVGGRLAPMLAAPLVTASLVVAVPVATAYGREPHPAFRALADMAERAKERKPAAVFIHYGLWRSFQAGSDHNLPLSDPRRQYEWMGLVEYWRNGGREPVWFLADPRRTDLALIDPQSRRDVVQYRWSVAGRPELGGSRPLGADWYRFEPPGWFAGEGWSLTPETGGIARATGSGPDSRPIHAWVRRQPGPMQIVVGGRHLGTPGDPAADFVLSIDGTVVERWSLTVEQRNFLRFIDLPQGLPSGPGAYADLTIGTSAATGASPRAAVAVRQFDVQPASQFVYGFGPGWHEEEYEPATGRRWRWTSERSVLQTAGPPRAVRITLRGESPLHYFNEPPTVRITAGGRIVAQFRPAADFEWSTTVPSDLVALSNGEIAVETDRVYLPGEAEGTEDERHLGLRVFESSLIPVLP